MPGSAPNIKYLLREKECVAVVTNDGVKDLGGLMQKWTDIAARDKRQRHDAVVFRHLQIQLPNAWHPDIQKTAGKLEEFLEEKFGRRFDFAAFVHDGRSGEAPLNFHFHLIWNERNLETGKKERSMNKYGFQKDLVRDFWKFCGISMAMAAVPKQRRIDMALWKAAPEEARRIKKQNRDTIATAEIASALEQKSDVEALIQLAASHTVLYKNPDGIGGYSMARKTGAQMSIFNHPRAQNLYNLQEKISFFTKEAERPNMSFPKLQASLRKNGMILRPYYQQPATEKHEKKRNASVALVVGKEEVGLNATLILKILNMIIFNSKKEKKEEGTYGERLLQEHIDTFPFDTIRNAFRDHPEPATFVAELSRQNIEVTLAHGSLVFTSGDLSCHVELVLGEDEVSGLSAGIACGIWESRKTETEKLLQLEEKRYKQFIVNIFQLEAKKPEPVVIYLQSGALPPAFPPQSSSSKDQVTAVFEGRSVDGAMLTDPVRIHDRRTGEYVDRNTEELHALQPIIMGILRRPFADDDALLEAFLKAGVTVCRDTQGCFFVPTKCANLDAACRVRIYPTLAEPIFEKLQMREKLFSLLDDYHTPMEFYSMMEEAGLLCSAVGIQAEDNKDIQAEKMFFSEGGTPYSPSAEVLDRLHLAVMSYVSKKSTNIEEIPSTETAEIADDKETVKKIVSRSLIVSSTSSEFILRLRAEGVEPSLDGDGRAVFIFQEKEYAGVDLLDDRRLEEATRAISRPRGLRR